MENDIYIHGCSWTGILPYPFDDVRSRLLAEQRTPCHSGNSKCNFERNGYARMCPTHLKLLLANSGLDSQGPLRMLSINKHRQGTQITWRGYLNDFSHILHLLNHIGLDPTSLKVLGLKGIEVFSPIARMEQSSDMHQFISYCQSFLFNYYSPHILVEVDTDNSHSIRSEFYRGIFTRHLLSIPEKAHNQGGAKYGLKTYQINDGRNYPGRVELWVEFGKRRWIAPDTAISEYIPKMTGLLDALLCNAGISTLEPIGMMTWEEVPESTGRGKDKYKYVRCAAYHAEQMTQEQCRASGKPCQHIDKKLLNESLRLACCSSLKSRSTISDMLRKAVDEGVLAKDSSQQGLYRICRYPVLDTADFTDPIPLHAVGRRRHSQEVTA